MNHTDRGALRLGLLRAWRLHRDEVPVHVASRQQRLIAALAVNGPSLRSYLVGLLWPESPEVRALENLRVSVHLTTREIPGLLINDGSVLSLSEGVDVDLHRVRARIADLDRLKSDADAMALLREVRDARLLPGWYEDWVVFEQNRLQHDCLHACMLIAGKYLDRSSCETAAAAAEAALEIEPLYEEAVRILIAAELKNENVAAAVRVYQRYQMRLDEDMHLRPSKSLILLVAHALEGQAQAPQASVTDGGSRFRVQPLTYYSEDRRGIRNNQSP